MSSYRLFFVFIFLIFCALGVQSQLKGDNLQVPISKQKVYTVHYVYQDLEGFTEVKDGQRLGFLFDIMAEFERYMYEKHQVQIVSNVHNVENFPDMMEVIKNSGDGVFGVGTISKIEERKKFLTYGPVFMNNVLLLATHMSTPTLTKLSNINVAFKDLTAYYLANTTYEDRLNELKSGHFSNMQMKQLPSVRAIIEQIGSDPNAYGTIDVFYYLLATKWGIRVRRHPVGDKKGDTLHLVTSLSSNWNGELNAFFQEFKDSPKYNVLISKNLGTQALRLISNL